MIKIRNIKESDIPSIAHIHRESWRVAYQGILPQSYLDSLSLDSLERRWKNGMSVNGDVVRLVALDKSVPIGFIAGLENRTPEKCPEASGEIWSFYVHPSHWGKGAGKMLFHEFEEVMKAKGHKKLCLWVLEDNKRGRAFYEAMGGRFYPATQEREINGEKFKEIAYLING